MPRVAVLIPWGDTGCPHRRAALTWVRHRYERELHDARIVIARIDGPWCKANAVMPAARSLDADLVIVADADVWTDGIPDALNALKQGAPWAIPHHLVKRLDETATRELLAGHPDRPSLAEMPYRGVLGGGIVALPLSTLLDVPLDPRFIGWGQEDISWGTALRTLAGQPWRGTHDLIHLWHPAPERMTRKIGNPAGRTLHRRYALARRDPASMRVLIQEAQSCPSPTS